jgi:hypothetical protein
VTVTPITMRLHDEPDACDLGLVHDGPCRRTCFVCEGTGRYYDEDAGRDFPCDYCQVAS